MTKHSLITQSQTAASLNGCKDKLFFFHSRYASC